ncbi:hypothetical protein [Sphingomonas baiyangensis]|uniref:Uncharacterized protein n=1 Tax=Sphingomonas baiyangensis TaxID=2572576 RepID=A0A4U1L502_9SPHN|nr:hypothetical protein [Sphingomonas baiyangensis]TKD51862.1 hypothetical protein FBR43_14760 [Sphingomonas baiyangensis]
MCAKRIAGALIAASALGGASFADDGAVRSFEALRLSAEMARAGSAARDPLLLLAAARVRRSAPITFAADADDRSAGWIAAAEAMAGDDPRIATLAADIRAEGRKGRIDGPRVSQARLAAGERRRFTERFRAGRPAVVYVEGDGDTDLGLRVGAACRNLDPGDIKICSWTPSRAESVTVEIANLGRVDNRVILGMN